jgi:glycine/D-amino acid oxidase-like deaminating enzyme
MFHPLRYLAALARAVQNHGGRLCSMTKAARIDGSTVARVQTENGPTGTASAVVVATNSPINDLFVLHTKQAPYMTYAVGRRRRGRPLSFAGTSPADAPGPGEFSSLVARSAPAV